MTRISLPSIISERLVTRFQGVAAGTSSSSNTLSGSASSASTLRDGLRLGARTYGTAVQGLNSLLSFVNLSQSTLKELSSITEKLITVAERAGQAGTGSDARGQLERKFRELAKVFQETVSSSVVGEKNYLDRDGLIELFKTLGLDSSAAGGVANLFEKFRVSDEDSALASEHLKAKRPIQIPAGAYQTVSTPSGDGTYNPEVSHPTDAAPQSVQQSDLNGDGLIDLIANGGSSVSILMGNGDGTFQSGAQYSTQVGVSGSVTRDINRDGITDVVVVGGEGRVDVVIGNGDGSFKERVSYDAGIGSDVTAEDFNDDGYADLAITLAGEDKIGVLFGNGDGSFGSMTRIDAGIGDSPAHVASADFNGDGAKDLVVSNEGSGTVNIYIGNRDGSFKGGVSFGVGTTPSDITTSDFNGDGWEDFVVSTQDAGGNVRVFLGNGDASFRAPLSLQAGDSPSQSLAKDLNGDGVLDLLVANSAQFGGTPGVSVFLGNGDGTFQASTSYAAGISNAFSIAANDFTGDGVTDIALGSGDSTVRVLTGNPGQPSVRITGISSKEYDGIFDTARSLRSRPDAYRILADLKELRSQIQTNMKTLETAAQFVKENISLVRQTGFAFLELSDQLNGNEDAKQVASQLQTLVRKGGSSGLSQLENLESITVAALTIDSSSISK